MSGKSHKKALQDILLADIAANPHDDTPRLVYADWLDNEDGQTPQDKVNNARAEFIRTQCELARLPEEGARYWQLKRREAELLQEHRAEWVKELPTFLQNDAAEFRRGFVEHVAVEAHRLPRNEQVLKRALESHPIHSLDVNMAGTLHAFEGLAVLQQNNLLRRRIDELSLRVPRYSGWNGIDGAEPALTDFLSGDLSQVKKLGLYFNRDPHGFAENHTGAVNALANNVTFRPGGFALHNVTWSPSNEDAWRAFLQSGVMQKLRSFEVEGSFYMAKRLTELLAASTQCSALESLTFNRGSMCGDWVKNMLSSSTHLSSLREMSFVSHEPRQVFTALAESPRAVQLTNLRFGNHEATYDDVLEPLLRRDSHLRNLHRLQLNVPLPRGSAGLLACSPNFRHVTALELNSGLMESDAEALDSPDAAPIESLRFDAGATRETVFDQLTASTHLGATLHSLHLATPGDGNLNLAERAIAPGTQLTQLQFVNGRPVGAARV